MSRNKKILLGVLSFWPVTYLVLFFVGIFGSMFLMVGGGLFTATTGSEAVAPLAIVPFVAFPVIFLLHFATIFLMLGLGGYYIYRVVTRDDFDEKQTILWSLFLFMGNMAALPTYWYFHIWEEKALLGGADETEDSTAVATATEPPEQNGHVA